LFCYLESDRHSTAGAVERGKLYDEGEAKEGVGAGGALVYGILNGLGKEDITKEVEGFLG